MTMQQNKKIAQDRFEGAVVILYPSDGILARYYEAWNGRPNGEFKSFNKPSKAWAWLARLAQNEIQNNDGP